MLVKSSQLGLRSLEAICRAFVLRHAGHCFGNIEVASHALLASLLGEDDLRIDEVELFRHLKAWGERKAGLMKPLNQHKIDELRELRELLRMRGEDDGENDDLSQAVTDSSEDSAEETAELAAQLQKVVEPEIKSSIESLMRVVRFSAIQPKVLSTEIRSSNLVDEACW